MEVVKGVLNDVMDVTIDSFMHVGCDEIGTLCYGGKEETTVKFREYGYKLQDIVKSRGMRVTAAYPSIASYRSRWAVDIVTSFTIGQGVRWLPGLMLS